MFKYYFQKDIYFVWKYQKLICGSKSKQHKQCLLQKLRTYPTPFYTDAWVYLDKSSYSNASGHQRSLK